MILGGFWIILLCNCFDLRCIGLRLKYADHCRSLKGQRNCTFYGIENVEITCNVSNQIKLNKSLRKKFIHKNAHFLKLFIHKNSHF